MRVALLGLAASAVAAEKVTPIQKVLTLLSGMMQKGKDEKQEEAVLFSQYKQFCDDTEEEKTRAIATAESRIEQMAAAIQKYDSTAARLANEISVHEGDVATWTGDVKAATKVRDIEKTDYDATHKDYSESIDALNRATAVLKKQAYDRQQQADALLQVKQKSLIPDSAKDIIDQFLQTGGPLDISAPEANAYEFQSGGVIEMLEKLSAKFEDEMNTLVKEEKDSLHAFNILMQDMSSQIKQAEDTIAEKKVNRAAAMKASGEAAGDLADTTATRDEDKAYLADLQSTCKIKSDDFEARQKLRAEEIEAIEKAITIMSSDDINTGAEYLPKLTQTSTSFLQMKIETANPLQEKAAAFLTKRADVIGSRILTAIALQTAADPFAKVTKMIKDLITRLVQEAGEEAEHKQWCDKELSVNEATRKQKTAATEMLHAEKDELEATVAKLTKRISELQKQIAALDEAMLKATNERQAEKKTNEQTIVDAKAAQDAVQRGLKVLKDFYAKAATATQLTQEPSDAPKIFDKPYTGMQSENGGVIGMLEVIESDFARLESDTKTSEEASQAEYDKFMADSREDRAQKKKDEEHKTNKKQDTANALVLKKEDLAATQKDLNAALDYFQKLKPSCITAGFDYDERVKRREDEIASLKDALKILGGEGGI